MDNPLTGVFTLHLGGKPYRLQFNWNAIAQITKRFGVDRDLADPDVLSQVVAIGLQRHHPDEATAEFVMESSPPLVETMNVVTMGLQYAYYGDKGVQNNTANPQMARSRTTKAKASPAPSSSASEPESDPTTSGT